MLPWELPSLREPGATVVAVGAHADDVEIGAGGTLRRLREAHPAARMRWLVCAADGQRAEEARTAAAEFGADDITIWDAPDRFFPSRWEELKRRFGDYAANLERCDLVLSPWRHDRHQDHRAVAELVWQSFRDTAVWAYEIVKYEGDLGHPNLYVRLSEPQLAEKVEALNRCFPSQRDRAWFDGDTFRGLARIRGVECGEQWAEAFHAEKMVW